MPFEKLGKRWKPGFQHVLVVSTGPLHYRGKFVSKLPYIREARNYGESFIYQVQTLFLVILVYQKTNNLSSGVIIESAFQQLVQLVNIHTTRYITSCMGIGEISTVGTLPQPHLSGRGWQMKVLLGFAVPRLGGEAGHVIQAYLSSRAQTIFYHS